MAIVANWRKRCLILFSLKGRDAVRLKKKAEEKRCEDNSAILDKVIWLKTISRLTKVTVLAITILLANSMPGNHAISWKVENGVWQG